MIRIQRRSLGRLLTGLVASAVFPVLHAGCGVPPEEPLGSAEEAVTTCITVQRGTSGTVADSFVRNDATTSNNGASGSLTASLASPTLRHAVVRWDLGAVPAGATVTSATASLKVNLNGGALVHAHRITTAWGESTVTWANLPDSAPTTGVAANFSAATAGQVSTADLTALTQAWVSGTYANDGVILERDDSSGSTIFASSEDPTVGNRPSLQVCYTPASLCAGVTCSPSDTCHTAACNPSTGTCTQTAKTNGTTCSDGNACTLTDTCQAGVCTGGSPVTCGASDQCHGVGTCNPATGACSNPALADGTACSDGNACTLTDTCQSGACSGGSPVTCAPVDQCHAAGSCNPGSGACSSPVKPDGSICDDGDPLTVGDNCVSGACVGYGTAPWTLSRGSTGTGSCAVRTGQLKCWGYDYAGELGQGDTVFRGGAPNQMGDYLAYVSLGTGRTVVATSVGTLHSCALLDNGQVKCWGYNYLGRLGVGDTMNRGDLPGEMGDSLPALNLGTGRTAVAVSAGGAHSCALLDNGQVKCWGYNYYGQLGVGDATNRGGDPTSMGDNLPYVNLGTGRTAVAVSVGNYHSCALLDNAQVKCWGWNVTAQLGTGDLAGRGTAASEMGDNLLAIDLGTGRTAVAISAGSDHTCALLDNAQIKCWGLNYNGEVGIAGGGLIGGASGQMGDSLPVVSLGTGRSAVAVSAGGTFTCALLDNAQVKCWGDNSSGASGLGNTGNHGIPVGSMGDSLPAVDLGTGRTALSVSANGSDVCVTLDNTQIKCWGANSWGQLGLGDTTNRGDAAGEMGDNLPAVYLGH